MYDLWTGAARSTWEWFDKINNLLGHRPMATASDYGLETQQESQDSQPSTSATSATSEQAIPL